MDNIEENLLKLKRVIIKKTLFKKGLTLSNDRLNAIKLDSSYSDYSAKKILQETSESNNLLFISDKFLAYISGIKSLFKFKNS